jgi:hypothetical protein
MAPQVGRLPLDTSIFAVPMLKPKFSKIKQNASFPIVVVIFDWAIFIREASKH